MLKRVVFIFSLFLFCSAAVVFADGDTRPITPAEKEFANHFYATAKAVFSAYKTDWKVIDQSKFEAESRVTVGNELQPWALYSFMQWQDAKAKEAENTRIVNALPTMTDANLVNEANKVSQEIEKLALEAGKAAEAGDFNKMMELQKKMEALTAPAQEAFAENDRKFKQKMEQLVAKDCTLTARLSVNNFFTDLQAGFKQEKTADGLTLYRVSEGSMEGERWQEGTTKVVLGNGWQLNQEEDYASLEMPTPEEFQHTKVYSIILEVEAEQKRAADFIKALPWDKLKALMK
jgi:hypothetical protein